ncbi:MAG TPA: potassium-transporting ATPase subunit KdpA [Humidesulfovibrio sp.]|uniref:potassium-transporting ATPase subunit KdpA n=1 Tax=Humidesulfovibrio sp. TaxID=2910988 RepID=UPI002D1D4C7D|nr:potassium-transporting ATPase subunit KdpA [Humidesulfovibrio sp.]HWR05013.1 potassium-transporting ATPase subunit KdpA [Humidesulfovibrio sp.]
MSGIDFAQIGVFLALLLGLSWPLGKYMAAVLEGRDHPLARGLGWLERGLYRACGVDPAREMDWKAYALAMFLFNVAGFAALYLLLRIQGWLPLNPDGQTGMAPDLAFNTAMSFASNTNWQAYSGESAVSHLTQMLGLTVHNFVSAATGIAVLSALIRGLTRRETREIGNFWADLVRSTLYILLPLALVLSLALVWQGVPQTFSGAENATLAEPVAYEISPSADDLKADPSLKPTPATATEQAIMRGPMASQEAIKELGTNGGGFFNANSAHPFENPTPLTNLLEMLAILIIPAGLCHAFGRMVGDSRQGWVLLGAMTALFLGFLALCWWAEAQGVPQVAAITGGNLPGNMEGKELRFGVIGSALFATVTTAASCGAVNAMHDSLTPLGGLAPMVLMQLGEVVFGGVGSGLYGMVVFAVIAVFVAGLMVGRTPEYLGKKIEAFETKMCSIVIMVPLFGVLLGTAWAVLTEMGRGAVANPGAHGFSEILYAFSSMANNNGSAFAGLSANNALYNLLGGLAMCAGRFWTAIPVLALAGSLAGKKAVPTGAGTLPTHTPLFCGLLVSVVLVVGALTFIPALALGPIVEHLQMLGR